MEKGLGSYIRSIKRLCSFYNTKMVISDTFYMGRMRKLNSLLKVSLKRLLRVIEK